MSLKLPRISGREAIKAFQGAEWQLLPKRGKGDHFVMYKPGMPVTLSIPDHDALGVGLLRKLIRLAGLTVEEFIELL